MHMHQMKQDTKHHHCGLTEQAYDLVTRYIDGGIFVNFRRALRRFTMIDTRHPLTLSYAPSLSVLKHEKKLHLIENYLMIHPLSMFSFYYNMAVAIVFIIYFIFIPVYVALIRSRTLVTYITLPLNMNLAKAKWKNPKDKFRIELKNIPQSRSGAGAEQYEGKWPFFPMMMFLKDTIAPSPMEGNLQPQSVSPEHEENNEDSEDIALNSDIDPILSPSVTTPSHNESRPTSRSTNISQNYRKKKASEQSDIDKYLDMERQKIEVLRGQQNRDSANGPDYHFLMSLLSYFEQFDPLEKIELRTTIQNVIITALKKKQNNSRNMQEEVACVPPEHHQTLVFNAGQDSNNICGSAFDQNEENRQDFQLYQFP